MKVGILAPLFVLLMAVPVSADPKQDAAALAATSAKHYKRGEFEQAAALLREAYAQYPEPNLLYNLARALEGLGDRAGAIEAYEQYLATGKRIEDRGGIERRVTTLKLELEERREKPVEPAPPPVLEPKLVEPAPVVEIEKPLPMPPPKRRTLPAVTIATGVAITVAGLALGYQARSLSDQSGDAMSGAQAADLHDRARSRALAANICYGVGAAVLVTGVVVLVW